MCWPWIGGKGISCLQKTTGARRPNPRRQEKTSESHRAQAARSCHLPTEQRRSNSRGSLRIVSGLAANPDSIFCDGPHRPETANGCPVLRRQEPPPRGNTCGLRGSGRFGSARSSVARVRRVLFSLDKDLHGCRLTESSPQKGLLGSWHATSSPKRPGSLPYWALSQWVSIKSHQKTLPTKSGGFSMAGHLSLGADDVSSLKALGAFEEIKLHGLALVERSVPVLLNPGEMHYTS